MADGYLFGKRASFGASNVFSSSSSGLIVGNSNTLSGNRNIVGGSGSKIEGDSSYHNIAYGTASTVKGNYDNFAIGYNCLTGPNATGGVALGIIAKAGNIGAVSAGYNVNASGAKSVALGSDSVSSGYESIAIGRASTASATRSTSIGGGTASSTGAICFGMGSNNPTISVRGVGFGSSIIAAGRYGAIAFNPTHATSGLQFLHATGSTTDAVQTVITLCNKGTTTGKISVAEKSKVGFQCHVTAISTSDHAKGAYFKIEGLIGRDNSNNTILIGSLDNTTIAESIGGTVAATVAPNDTAETIEIKVTGVAATNIDWSAIMQCYEIED